MHPFHNRSQSAPLIGTWLALLAGGALAAGESPDVAALTHQAQVWLLSQQDAAGTFGPPEVKMSLGITALAVQALCKPPGLAGSEDAIQRAVAVIKAHQQPDGGFYLPEEGLAVYGTSFCLLALIAAHAADPQTIAKAQAFLTTCQVTGTGPSAGGIGYGGTQKSAAPTHADLSNTHMALRALVGSGVPASDPRIAAIIPFLEHCQQLSAVNHLPWVSMSPDQAGGAVYNPDPQPRPPKPGATTAPTPPATPTAYASMTWALIDSYAEAGVPEGDQRPQAARDWIAHHFSLDTNAGRAEAKIGDGLYYGYLMMSEALAHRADSSAPLALADGRTADWRAELGTALAARAHHDGASAGAYWVNEAKNWSESNPLVVTSYVLETLKNLRPAK